MDKGNFRIIATADEIMPDITQGKIYEFINGTTTWDNGIQSGCYDDFNDFRSRNKTLCVEEYFAKEVGRQGEVGEYIKITNAISSNYKDGDILKVVKLPYNGSGTCGVKVSDGSGGTECVCNSEYVVLENYQPEKSKPKALADYSNRELAAELLRRYDNE